MLLTSGWRQRAIATLSTLLLASGLVAAAPFAANAVDASITITSSATTSNVLPTIEGTYDRSASPAGSGFVKVYLGEGEACTAYVTAVSGSFSCTSTRSLEPGSNPIQAQLYSDTGVSVTFLGYVNQTLVYSAGTPSPASVSITSADSTATAQPTIQGAYDFGGVTPTTDGYIVVYVGTTSVCTVFGATLVAAASGTYSCTLTSPLTAGANNLSVTFYNDEDVLASATQTLTYTAPAPTPAVTSVTITSSTTASTSTPLISGNYNWGSWNPTDFGAVLIVRDQSYGRDVCTIRGIELAGGAWSCVPNPGFDAGQTPLIVYLVRNASGEKVSATQTITVTLPVTSVAFTSGTVASSSTPTITGTYNWGPWSSTEAGARLVVSNLTTGATLCEISGATLSGGVWSCTPDAPLATGTNYVTAFLYKSQSSGANVSAGQYLSYSVPGATITGHVFNDVNGNGVQDASEPDISNVTVELWKLNEDGSYAKVASTVTHSPYVFSNVTPGSYQVRVPAGTSIAGYTPLATALIWNVTVSAPGTYTESASSFGLTPASAPASATLAYTGAGVEGPAQIALRFLLLGFVLVAAATVLRRRTVELS
ncbi:hypothetical protein BH11ACT5_BH11ACT5_06350 [soil metagenome]